MQIIKKKKRKIYSSLGYILDIMRIICCYLEGENFEINMKFLLV